jgi:DNA replication protein DnaC
LNITCPIFWKYNLSQICAVRKSFIFNIPRPISRLPDLLNEFAVAKALNTQNKVKTAYAKLDLLIIDEWLLRPLPEAEAYDLLEIIEACSKKGALILCTQYDTDDWYFRIDCDRAEDEESAVAEGILDRIIHNKYVIEVKGRISMRKRHAFAESDESEVNSNG